MVRVPAETLVGRTFNRLSVVRLAYRDANSVSFMACTCACGKDLIVRASYLLNAHTKSCGCWQKDHPNVSNLTHGQTGTREHNSYGAMVQRCSNPNDPSWDYYGGRGIRVCPEWRGVEGFSKFLADMGSRPEGMTLDRKDVNGDYTKSNCVWATFKAQANNRRNSVLIEYRDQVKTLAQWSSFTGISEAVIRWRLRRGWGVSRTLTQPTKKYKRKATTH